MRLDVGALIGLGRVESVAVAPDGTWLAVAVSRVDDAGSRYRSTLFRVPLDGTAAEPLLAGEAEDGAPCFRKDGALGFLSDRPTGAEAEADDSKRKQVWLWQAGEEPRPLTDEPLGVIGFRFARSADRLVVLAPVLPDVPHSEQRQAADDRRKHGPTLLHYDRMPVRAWDHWIPPQAPHFISYDGEGQQRRDLTPDAGEAYRDAEWDLSADGQRLATTFRTTGAFRLQITALAIHDLLQGTRQLLGHDDRTSHASPRLSADGQRVAVQRVTLSPEAIGPHRLWLYDLNTAEGHPLAQDWDRWPRPVGWADAHTVLVTADDGHDCPVFQVSLGSGSVRRITPAPGAYDQLAVHRNTLYGVHHSALAVPEVFRLPLEGAGFERLTRLATRSAMDELAQVEAFTVPASDGAEIPVRLIRPRDATGPLPTLIWIHGGPIHCWGDRWHWRWNPLLMTSAGYQVALPEPRGSTGWGQAWAEGIWGNVWGARCFQDVMEVTDALADRPEVDPARLAAMGGSFGGYMTNWIGTQTDRFACLVTHASLFSFSTFYGTTDNPAWWSHMLGGDPFADRESFERYSPDRHVGRWKSPTLILHGERDYRVPVSEALSLFEALQLHGVPSELAIFPDENHWILRPRNIAAWYDTVLRFLDRHLQQR